MKLTATVLCVAQTVQALKQFAGMGCPNLLRKHAKTMIIVWWRTSENIIKLHSKSILLHLIQREKKHANSKHTSNAANPNIFHMHLPEYWNPLELIHNFSLTFATSPLWAFTKSSLVSCPTSWLSSSAKAPCNKINKATIGYNLVE